MRSSEPITVEQARGLLRPLWGIVVGLATVWGSLGFFEGGEFVNQGLASLALAVLSLIMILLLNLPADTLRSFGYWWFVLGVTLLSAEVYLLLILPISEILSSPWTLLRVLLALLSIQSANTTLRLKS